MPPVLHKRAVSLTAPWGRDSFLVWLVRQFPTKPMVFIKNNVVM